MSQGAHQSAHPDVPGQRPPRRDRAQVLHAEALLDLPAGATQAPGAGGGRCRLLRSAAQHGEPVMRAASCLFW